MTRHWISNVCGNPNDPENLGRHPDFLLNSRRFNWFFDESEKSIDEGFVPCWHQMVGCPAGQDLYPSACGPFVLSMEDKRTIENRMPKLAAVPTIYTGVWVKTADSLFLKTGEAMYCDPSLHGNFLVSNWQFWLEKGLKEVILDNSAVNPAKAVKLAAWFRTRGVAMGIEGWAMDGNKIGGLSRRMPSVHVYDIVKRSFPHLLEPNSHSRMPADTHRPVILVQWHSKTEADVIREITQVGEAGFWSDFQGVLTKDIAKTLHYWAAVNGRPQSG